MHSLPYQHTGVYNMWEKLTGRLDKSVIEKAARGIAIKYNSGLVVIKEHTKSDLAKYDLSSLICEYRIL